MKKTSSYFHMPAEWAPHAATWIAWPHNRTDWPGKMAAIYWAYGELARHLAVGENVRILVNNSPHERAARRVLTRVHANLERIEFFHFPTNRGWTRDLGPLFVLDAQGKKQIADFQFNGWAKYPDWEKDNAVSAQAARSLKIPLIPVRSNGGPVVLEGGAIDVNGQGRLLTTEECLLDPSVQVRNPGWGKKEYEQMFKEMLGITETLWLANGIVGDDTHGHVDDCGRFVNNDTVVLAQEQNRDDANYRLLNENFERLQGHGLQVVPLPMPAPLYHDGRRLPASYANFYICNAAVLVPTFNDPNDRIALGILADLIPDRPVIGIHAVDLVWGLGTLHCLTQQEPA